MLERRVASLEQRNAVPSSEPTTFWVAERLKERHGTPFEKGEVSGSLVYAGVLKTPGSGSLLWQVEEPVPEVLATGWSPAAPVLAALAHPVRLEILRRLLQGAHNTQALQEIPELGTTGQLYHHLRQLQAAGFVVQNRRNDYALASEKVVSFLIIVIAAAGISHPETSADN